MIDPVQAMIMKWFLPEDAKPKEEPPTPEINPMLRWFAHEGFGPEFRELAELFGSLAFLLAGKLPMDMETTACLRKLLEARDCAVRAHSAGLQAEAIKERAGE